MKETKWLVINLKVPAEKSEKEDLLLGIFDGVISKFRDTVQSWHFLWEGKPYPHTLLLRFYGQSRTIDGMRAALKDYIDNKNLEYHLDNAYDGERNSYGVKGWKYVMGNLCLGADFAVDLIKNERTRNTVDFPKPLSCYVDRWMHLFPNQLGTRVSEYKVLFRFHAHRYVINQVGEERYRQVASDLEEEMPDLLNASTSRLDSFIARKAQKTR
jgi:hypothetical protein